LILLNEWVEKYNRDLSELNTEKREIAKTITET
jgi:hypothetical protein